MLNCEYFLNQVLISPEQLQPHSHIQVRNMNTIDTNNKKEFRTKGNVARWLEGNCSKRQGLFVNVGSSGGTRWWNMLLTCLKSQVDQNLTSEIIFSVMKSASSWPLSQVFSVRSQSSKLNPQRWDQWTILIVWLFLQKMSCTSGSTCTP